MTLRRIFQRLTFYPLRIVINLIEPLNSNSYRRLTNKLLKIYGLNIKGNPCYIHKTVKFDDFDRITIENNVVISFGVYLLTHDYSRLVAYNYFVTKSEIEQTDIQKFDNPLINDIIVGENSFIGCRTLVLPGTIIGKNCIIGSGSVVKGKIPDNSVVIGNPARIIGTISEFGQKWLRQHNIKNKNSISPESIQNRYANN